MSSKIARRCVHIICYAKPLLAIDVFWHMTAFVQSIRNKVATLTYRIDTFAVDTAFIRRTFTLIVYAVAIGTLAASTAVSILVHAVATGALAASTAVSIVVYAVTARTLTAATAVVIVILAIAVHTAFTAGAIAAVFTVAILYAYTVFTRAVITTDLTFPVAI